MKIGILSMQKVINYGSFLQAYALKQTYLQQGAESVDFIDIIPGKQLAGLEVGTRREKIKRGLGIIWKILTKTPKKTKELIRFRKEYPLSITTHWNLLGIDKKAYSTNFDLIVIGSDEVFNCCNATSWGFTSQLFGNIPNKKKCVSYAASFGSTKLQDIKKFHLSKELSYHLSNLDRISVRDDNSREIVRTLTGNEPYLHIDPVLLYDFSKEIEDCPDVTETDYIIVYTYPGRIKSKDERDAIIRFASEKKKKIYTIMCSYDWADELIVPSSPFGVLKWFKNASYVVTDTFHGTIFSIITQKQFAVLVRSSNKNKIGSLLKQLHLDRATSASDLRKSLCTPIDYTEVNKHLEELRTDARSYILTSLHED